MRLLFRKLRSSRFLQHIGRGGLNMESNKLLNDLFLTIRNDYAGWNAKQKRHNPTPFVTMLGQAYYDRRMSSLLVLQAVSQYCAGMRDRNLKFQLVQEGYAPFSRGFSVRRCAQGMVVDAVTQETRLHPGDRVLAINRTAPERIVKNLPNPLLAADEPEREQWNGYLKMARDITVRHPDGTEELLELARYPAEADTAPALDQPDPETVVLDPGTLNDADALEAFVEEHRAQLDGCTRLVLDLRDSNGDDEEALLPLLPYITAKDTTAEELFGDRRIRTNYTRMNCARLIHMLTPCLVDEDPEVRQMAQQLTAYYRDQSGKGWVDEVEELPVPAETPILRRGPEKVMVLTDTWCEQEAERFVQLAKRQGRAVLLGRPTMGTLDYTNPVMAEYDEFRFTYPISRTAASLEGNGVAERGLQPDILVPFAPEECTADLLLQKALQL